MSGCDIAGLSIRKSGIIVGPLVLVLNIQPNIGHIGFVVTPIAQIDKFPTRKFINTPPPSFYSFLG